MKLIRKYESISSQNVDYVGSLRIIVNHMYVTLCQVTQTIFIADFTEQNAMQCILHEGNYSKNNTNAITCGYARHCFNYLD